MVNFSLSPLRGVEACQAQGVRQRAPGAPPRRHTAPKFVPVKAGEGGSCPPVDWGAMPHQMCV